jgi:lipopolysaccharide transport system ATP-binding protein
MSSNPAVQIRGLGKEYRIGSTKEKYKTFGETVTGFFATPVRKVVRLAKGQASAAAGLDERIWALKDVSLKVNQGEAVAIIGKNGAGKTTLLKVLARITSPTTGIVDMYGRVGALLEVGTGFHPELTGRENIYLNGAILGMSKATIERKFDEIVEFSGVESFIDTPVKHFSSGMHMRLAFSVAAHLEPEILIIDEVLAVGDAEFQKKCLNKMESVGQSGRTVLFVSHNMAAVSRLCNRAVLLDNGKVIEDGPVESVVSSYLRAGLGIAPKRQWSDLSEAPGNRFVRLRGLRVVNSEHNTVDAIDMRKRVGIEIRFSILRKNLSFVPGISLFDERGTQILNALHTDIRWREPQGEGEYRCVAWIPANLLNEGLHLVSAYLMDVRRYSSKPVKYVYVEHCIAFQVVDAEEGASAKGDYTQHWPSSVYPLLEWDVERVDARD